MVSNFLVKIGESAGLAHVPGSPEQTLGNVFISRCKCGQFCKSAATPTGAYKNAQDHADHENGGGAETSPEALRSGSEPGTAAPVPYRSSRPEKAHRSPSEKPPPRPCSCSCGGTTGGGLFLPGHDAKLLGRLATEVKARQITVAQALEALTAMPKLKAKLESRMRTAGLL